MDILLVLGCNGFVGMDKFVFCPSTNNCILNISKLERKEEILLFLENTCGLFNGPINDPNKSMNILSMLYRDFKVISSEMLYNIQSFSRQHKSCGIYLALVLSDAYYSEDSHG